MKNIHKYIAYVLVLSGLFAGCEKRGQAVHELTFDAQVDEDTRAAGLFTASTLASLGEFKVYGYDGSDQTVSGRSVYRSTASGLWQFEDNPIIWIDGHTMTFWAGGNLPEWASVTSSAKESATLTVSSVPSDASSQWDPLVGYYSGTGDNGKATVTFSHPLTAVSFKTGELGDSKYNITGITSVKMKGVHKTGTAVVTPGPSYSWTTSGTVDVTGTFTGTESSVPFILIPQDLSSANVSLEITVSRSSGGDKTMSATLSSGSWVAGKLNVYTLDYVNNKFEESFTVSLTDWEDLNNSSDGTYFDAQYD